MRQKRTLADGRIPDIPQRDECPVAGLLATAESDPLRTLTVAGAPGRAKLYNMSSPDDSPEELAVRSGYWRVSLPSWLLMMAFFWPPILFLGVDQAVNTSRGLWTVGSFFVLGIVAAWAWWSVAAPRWRLWAYRRSKDLALLEQLAVADKLVWPVSHPFTRTELRVGKLGLELREFEILLQQAKVR